MAAVRSRYQGVYNIVRFNWHFYVLAGLVFLIALLALRFLPDNVAPCVVFSFIVGALLTLSSLVVSYYVYDCSDLYKLGWLSDVATKAPVTIVNIHAGLDEFSELLQNRLPQSKIFVFDFYDPTKHTEVSIKRARKAYPVYPGTTSISTHHIPLKDRSAELVFLFLAAHEIREESERRDFFKEVMRVLKDDGRVLVTEHLRGLPNFLAYNIGFFHFLPRACWERAFRSSGMVIEQTIKTTPFVSTFVLKKHGAAS